MTAIVNGQPWSAVKSYTGSGALTGTYIGGVNDSSEIEIYYGVSDTGTYPINNVEIDGTYSHLLRTYASIANSGSVHFSVLSQNQAVGTFNFVAIDSAFDTVTVTNGVFNIGI